MASAPISMEEWLAELDRLGIVGEEDSDAVTTNELVRLTGHSLGWIRRRLRQALDEGLIEPVHKRSQTIDGRSCVVPAYRFVSAKKDKKK